MVKFKDAPWLYLGPLGALRALPSPDTEWESTQEVVGSDHESLIGRRTRFIQAYKRTWKIDFPNLRPKELAVIEALYMNLDNEPLYLVDPLRVNRLDRWLSTGGSERASQSTIEGSGVVVETGTDTPSELPLGRSVRLHSPDSGSGFKTSDPIPVVPGETLTLSAYVKGGSCALSFEWRDRAGKKLSTDTSGDEGSSSWQRMHTTATVPDEAAEVRLALTMKETTDDFYTTGWMLSPKKDHVWVPGTGSPEVYVDEVESETPIYPLVTASVKIKEV